MPDATIYHTTDFNKVHLGPKATCKACAKIKKNPPPGTKKSGSNGGKKSGRKRANPPRKCSVCKKDIHRQNKSGMCMGCLRQQQIKNIAKKVETNKRYCSKCEKPIARINKSGLCQRCWNKSPKAIGARRKSQAWINSAVFSKNATPVRDSTDVP